MAAVSADGYVAAEVERTVGQVSAGFTYFERGDVVVAKITPCVENGKAAHTTNLKHEVGFGTTEFHVLRPGPEIHGRYLFYMIWNPYFRFVAARNMTGSAGQRRVPADFVRRFAIPLPPISEQKRFATILDQADTIHRKRCQALAEVAGLRLSMFYDSFGDPFANKHGWSQRRVDECGTVQGGIALGSRRNGYSLQMPYLRVANVYRDRLDLSEIKTIGVTEAEAERTKLDRGDILVVEGHGNPEEIGRCAVWDGSISPCLHQNHLIKIRPDTSKVTPNYLSTFLNSPEGRRQLIRAGKTTSGLNTISLSNVRSNVVELPPLQLQERYEETLKQSECIQYATQQACVVAGDLFDSLIHRTFRGEL
jgi:type I restriction enzyme S subunit